MQSVDALNEAVTAFSTMEEVMKYLEPDRWQVDMEDLYKPTWQVVGKSFFHQKKSRGKIMYAESAPTADSFTFSLHSFKSFTFIQYLFQIH